MQEENDELLEMASREQMEEEDEFEVEGNSVEEDGQEPKVIRQEKKKPEVIDLTILDLTGKDNEENVALSCSNSSCSGTHCGSCSSDVIPNELTAICNLCETVHCEGCSQDVPFCDSCDTNFCSDCSCACERGEEDYATSSVLRRLGTSNQRSEGKRSEGKTREIVDLCDEEVPCKKRREIEVIDLCYEDDSKGSKMPLLVQ